MGISRRMNSYVTRIGVVHTRQCMETDKCTPFVLRQSRSSTLREEGKKVRRSTRVQGIRELARTVVEKNPGGGVQVM